MTDNPKTPQEVLAEALAIEAGPLPDYCKARIERTTWAKRMIVSLGVRGWRLTNEPTVAALVALREALDHVVNGVHNVECWHREPYDGSYLETVLTDTAQAGEEAERRLRAKWEAERG